MINKMTKRQIAAMETRKRLLVAARKILYGRDFSEVSVADIAKEAGTAVGSFYVYFKRKEDIVEELRRYDFYHLAEIVNGMAGIGILERLSYYCREFMKGIEECGLEITRQWIRNNVAPQQMCHNDEEITKYAFDYRAVQSILTEGVKSGLLTSDTPVDSLALFINSQLYGLMLTWCMSDGAIVGSEKIEAMANAMLKPILEQYIVQS